MWISAVMLALFLLQPRSLSASGTAIDLHATPLKAMAPADVFIRVVIDRDAGNRQIRVAMESGVYFRASTIELDGESAPRVTEIAFRGLPAGEYDLRVQVLDARGHERAGASCSVTRF